MPSRATSLTVYHDGSCPLCRREIAFYRRRNGAERIDWVDVSADGVPLDGDLSQSAAMARFHVRDQTGRLLSGGRAFSALWRQLPAFRFAGKVFGLPGLSWLLDRAYDAFLPIRPYLQRLAKGSTMDLAEKLKRELRSDHAGETGAVWIYKGILFLTRDPDLRTFATHHLETEQGHLDLLEELLPPFQRSRLVPIWRVAGWLTGALPAVFGPAAVYATIDAVETFVDHHYQAQIDMLEGEPRYAKTRELLIRCQADEVDHRDQARERAEGGLPVLTRVWMHMVGGGSAAAVALAKRV